MQRMRSIVRHEWFGKAMNPGDEFDASAQEERVLVALGRAVAITVEDQEAFADPRESRRVRRTRRDLQARPAHQYETKDS